MKIKSLFSSLAILALTSITSADALPMPRSKAPDFSNVNAVVGQEFQKISLS